MLGGAVRGSLDTESQLSAKVKSLIHAFHIETICLNSCIASQVRDDLENRNEARVYQQQQQQQQQRQLHPQQPVDAGPLVDRLAMHVQHEQVGFFSLLFNCPWQSRFVVIIVSINCATSVSIAVRAIHV
jgi:hypothetical protein